LSENRGKKGKDILTDTYISVQKYFGEFSNRYQLCICPTCNELINGVKYQDLLVSVDQPCFLSICRAFKFLKEDNQDGDHSESALDFKDNSEAITNQSSSSGASSSSVNTTDSITSDYFELFETKPIVNKDTITDEISKSKSKKKGHNKKQKEPEEEYDPDTGIPLFMDVNNSSESKKPKWELVFGVGPARLELDSSRSGRIYKPSLKSTGLSHLSTQLYKLDEDKKITADGLKEICNDISECVNTCFSDSKQLERFVNTCLLPNVPLFDHYDNIKSIVEDLLEEARQNRQEEQRQEASLKKYHESVSLTQVLSKNK